MKKTILFLSLLIFTLSNCSSEKQVKKIDDNGKKTQLNENDKKNQKTDPVKFEFEIDFGKNKKMYFKSKWAKTSQMPLKVNAFGIAQKNQKVYLLGGYGTSGLSNRFYEYDLISKKWTRLKDMPRQKSSFSAAIFQNKLYSIGGFGKSGPLKEVDIYDFDKKEWKNGPILKNPRYQHKSIVFQNRLYVVGGLKSKNSVIYLNIGAEKWQKGPDLNTNRDSHDLAFIDNQIVVIGGKKFGSGLTSVEALKKSSNHWIILGQIPTSIFGFVSLPYKKNIIIIGGFKDISARGFLNSVTLYLIYQKKIFKAVPLPIGLANFGAVLYKDSIYLFGGRSLTGLSDSVLKMDMKYESSSDTR